MVGQRWSLIAGRLPGRTDNEIKNYWNTNLGKRVHGQSSQPAKSEGKNPVTEPPMIDPSPPETTPDAQVIRTKAARCTRTFFTPDQHHLNLKPKGTVISSEILPRNDSFNDVTVSEGIQIGGHARRQDGYSANLDVQLDDPAPFGGFMLEDWFSSECFEPDITVDFQSLASFLHSEDEWN